MTPMLIPLYASVLVGKRSGRVVGQQNDHPIVQFDDELDADPPLTWAVNLSLIEVLFDHDPKAYPFVWYVRTRFPDRKGQRCRVLTPGLINSVLVEFQDGFRVVTSRSYIHKAE